jgi:hypothetical protein
MQTWSNNTVEVPWIDITPALVEKFENMLLVISKCPVAVLPIIINDWVAWEEAELDYTKKYKIKKIFITKHIHSLLLLGK